MNNNNLSNTCNLTKQNSPSINASDTLLRDSLPSNNLINFDFAEKDEFITESFFFNI